MSKPHPIGYVEVQKSFVGYTDPSVITDTITEVRAEMKRDRPDLIPCGSRMETVTDGAGVPHYTLYMGFAPIERAAEPLNPRNLNDAPAPRIGDMPDVAMPLGMKERKF